MPFAPAGSAAERGRNRRPTPQAPAGTRPCASSSPPFPCFESRCNRSGYRGISRTVSVAGLGHFERAAINRLVKGRTERGSLVDQAVADGEAHQLVNAVEVQFF